MPEPQHGAGQARSQATSLPSPAPKPLAGRFIDLARDGWTETSTYVSIHAAAMAIACALVRAQHPKGVFIDLLTDPINRLGEQYRINVRKPYNRVGDRAYLGKLDRTWAKALRLIAASTHPTNDVEALQTIGEARAAAAAHQWSGRAGLRDKEVLAIVHAIAQERATGSPSVSVREIFSRSTYRNVSSIVRALASLRDAGWFDSRRDPDPALPSTYYLRWPDEGTQSISLTGVVGAAAPKHTVDADRSLGRKSVAMMHGQPAALVWSVLSDEPLRQHEVIERSGTSKPTVRRWLPRLAASGLATQTPEGWVTSTAGLPDAEAEAADVEALRDQRIKLDRAAWAVWNEQRRVSVERSRKAEAEAKRRGRWKKRGEK